jgi:predicted dehydrogenase
MDKIRFGIIGLGNMGSGHLGYISQVEGAVLSALCDINPEKRAKYQASHPNVRMFATHKEMLASGTVDAIIIAVPHYSHMPIAADAFEKGIHVLCEKPLAVSVKAGREGIAAYEKALKKYPKLKFGIMFQARTNPMFQKLRELIVDGEVGEISRITWIATNWFRTWTYYASGGWRATWKGEGGGVLINQCPHNLDMIQYAFGNLMPVRVTAIATVGKTHPIEVEDDVSAILEYPNGAVGHFITTTGEAPGTNRLEVAGDRGKIVAEDGKLVFHRTRQSVQQTNRTSTESFANVETWRCEIPFRAGWESHKVVTENFVQAVHTNLANEKLLAPGPEGIRGLEIGNAIMMAGLTRTLVTLPVDGAKYDAFIEDMAKKYGGKKTLQTQKADVDLGASFQKA